MLFLVKVIHHFKHQMTSPATLIPQPSNIHCLLCHFGLKPPPSLLFLIFSCRTFKCTAAVKVLSHHCWPEHIQYKATWVRCVYDTVCVGHWICNQYYATMQPLHSCKAMAALMNCDPQRVHYDSH